MFFVFSALDEAVSSSSACQGMLQISTFDLSSAQDRPCAVHDRTSCAGVE